MIYFYENHETGGIIYSSEKLSLDDCYCDQCCEYDSFIGQASDRDEASNLFKHYPVTWEKDYIKSILEEAFDNK